MFSLIGILVGLTSNALIFSQYADAKGNEAWLGTNLAAMFIGAVLGSLIDRTWNE